MKRFRIPRLLASMVCLAAGVHAATFDLTKASIADMQAAMASGALTSEKLVQLYLNRIAAYDKAGPKINAVITLNPKALETARALDEERKAKGPRSPLHGIPFIVKDVFDTNDMQTTGGYLPLKGVIPDKDATVIKRLRAAGAIILAKVNQSDWYGQSEVLAKSSMGGSTLNPFDLTRIPGWSSAGTSAGLAAQFATAGLGSETGFSVRTPTSDGNLFGLASTSGLISRTGQMWSYITGERAGPMAHSVYDLCVTLDAIAGFDSADLWTANSLGKMPMQKYVTFIDKQGLRGARVGVLKEAFDPKFKPVDANVIEMARRAIKVFGDHGAKVFDPVSLGFDLQQYLAANGSPGGYERIAAINQYLAHQGPGYPYKTAADLLLGHSTPTAPNNKDLIEHPVDLDRDPEYRAALEGKVALRNAVLDLMDRYHLDALIYPHKLSGPLKIDSAKEGPFYGYVPNQMSPLTGFPAFIVPMGFTPDGLPVGLEILGRPWSEPTLIKLASGFEAVTDNRRLPATTPTLPGEKFDY